MKRTYECGIDTNVIKFTFKIGTVGRPGTEVSLHRSGGQKNILKQKIGKSIPKFSIGKSEEVKGGYLITKTYVDLSILNTVEDMKEEMEKIRTEYKLEGGKSKIQKYSHDLNDDMTLFEKKKLLLIIKPIKLT